MALMAKNLFGNPVLPTCKAATRHTFGVGNSDLTRFLKGAAVKYEHDLNAYSVQTFDFEFPTFNVPVWKWFLPVTLDSFDVDQRSIDTSAASVAGPLTLKLNELLGENKVDEALKTWSSVTEKHILQHCKDNHGTVPRGKRFIGRSSDIAPSKTLLAGLPEGDPMSIVGMYCLTYWFRVFALDAAPNSLPVGYADNWEALFPNVMELRTFLPMLSDFLDALRLPVNPGKCWTWSLDPEQRNALCNLQWKDQELQFKLQARELGADISYCLQRAARVRNSRIQSAHKRLLRPGGLPLPRPFKQRLLLAGIWPHALHAAETADVPKSVFGRLHRPLWHLGLRKKALTLFWHAHLPVPISLTPSLSFCVTELRCLGKCWRNYRNTKHCSLGNWMGLLVDTKGQHVWWSGCWNYSDGTWHMAQILLMVKVDHSTCSWLPLDTSNIFLPHLRPPLFAFKSVTRRVCPTCVQLT